MIIDRGGQMCSSVFPALQRQAGFTAAALSAVYRAENYKHVGKARQPVTL